nr:MAG TPA: hypothetical protein [Caudoviricetes sp.]
MQVEVGRSAPGAERLDLRAHSLGDSVRNTINRFTFNRRCRAKRNRENLITPEQPPF